MLKRLDAWSAAKHYTRSEAIRQMIELGLGSVKIRIKRGGRNVGS
jgi:metal-responsive CopG/Arc/MetJ family transcriptional regulator